MVALTDPVRRRVGVAALVGLIAGIFSAIVKFGWEIPFPPRTPERDATNPPQALLEMLGMSPDTSHMTYSYLGNERPIMSFVVHFGFAIFFGILYCVVAEYWPQIKLWQGAAFGIPEDDGFHNGVAVGDDIIDGADRHVTVDLQDRAHEFGYMPLVADHLRAVERADGLAGSYFLQVPGTQRYFG